jgi:hypothetical protein
MISFPDIAHNAFAVTGTVGHKDHNREYRNPAGLQRLPSLNGMINGLHGSGMLIF